ncbi:unnamed protein product [Rhizophagus irregularis]|nr:unnamed protein product [Rhizophagus irregularis]
MSSDNSTQEQWTSYQDFYDGCVNGLLPILFLTIYGPKPSPYLGNLAYFIDDVLVFGLLLFGPFTAMFFIETLKEKYILGLFSTAIIYALTILAVGRVIFYITENQKNEDETDNVNEETKDVYGFLNFCLINPSEEFTEEEEMDEIDRKISKGIGNLLKRIRKIFKRIGSKELEEGSKEDSKESEEGSNIVIDENRNPRIDLRID